MSVRLVLADDHPLVLKGLAQLCREEPDFEVVAECHDGRETVTAVRSRHPDVLVLDLHMPGMNGLDVIRELQSDGSKPVVVLLTASLSDEDVVQAMKLGVRGVVLKEMAPGLLLQCIRKVHSGGQWLEKESVGRALDKILKQEEQSQKLQAQLTPRELEVLKLVVSGMSNADVAEKLGVGEGTVKTHLHTVYDKLQVRGRVQLMLFARDNGLK
jgi:DNA-binding NarL/FixJ family response regulator